MGLKVNEAAGDVLAKWLRNAMYDAAKDNKGILEYGLHFEGRVSKKVVLWDRNWPAKISLEGLHRNSTINLYEMRILIQGDDDPNLARMKSNNSLEWTSNDFGKMIIEENYHYPYKVTPITLRSFFMVNMVHNINAGFIAGGSAKRLNIHAIQPYRRYTSTDTQK